jgi:hypothetical protein
MAVVLTSHRQWTSVTRHSLTGRNYWPPIQVGVHPAASLQTNSKTSWSKESEEHSSMKDDITPNIPKTRNWSWIHHIIQYLCFGEENQIGLTEKLWISELDWIGTPPRVHISTKSYFKKIGRAERMISWLRFRVNVWGERRRSFLIQMLLTRRYEMKLVNCLWNKPDFRSVISLWISYPMSLSFVLHSIGIPDPTAMPERVRRIKASSEERILKIQWPSTLSWVKSQSALSYTNKLSSVRLPRWSRDILSHHRHIGAPSLFSK